MEERLTPELLRAMAGVSRIPTPSNKAAFLSAVKRHTPISLREQGRTGFVLLDVVVGANGNVEKVTVVPTPSGETRHQAVLVRRDASGREVHTPMAGGDSDPQLGPAAEAALREITFTPAMRDGAPVSFTIRMGIHFTP